jgi:hypothetical protein
MTDGELLEQAAKAIGLKYIKPAEGYGGEFGLIAGKETLRSATDRCGATTWNPLADDGDAFRLAATMGFSLEFGKTGKASLHKDGEWLGTAIGSRGDGPAASMRRAIVILAAKQQQE